MPAAAILNIDSVETLLDTVQNAGKEPFFLRFRPEAQMELRKESDDRKIIAALVCLFIGFAFVWNVAVHITDIYEVYLDAETCERVKQLGVMPTANCVVTVPYRTAGMGPVGYMLLPEGNYIQVSPIAANRTNMTAEWSTGMKAQFLSALLFWVATLALLLSAFSEKK